MAEIEIVGNDGRILINDRYKNMVLTWKGNVTFPSPGSPIIGSLATFSYTLNSAIPPVLAIYSTFPVVVQSMSKVNNTYTWYIASGADGRGGTVEVYVFTLPQNVGDAGGIIHLFNDSGELVFDSNLKYMKVHSNLRHVLGFNTDFAVTPGHKYACVTSTAAGQFQQVPYPPLTQPPLYGVSEQGSRAGAYMRDGFISTRTFGYSSRNYATSQPPSGTYSQQNGVMLAIDVTGM